MIFRIYFDVCVLTLALAVDAKGMKQENEFQ